MSKGSQKKMKWWQLSLLGVGCIIGTGFFLGSSIAIRQAGPAVLVAFLFAALATYIVFDSLAQLTAEQPQKGSFSAYAKKAFGHWAGFSNGWVYWSSEMLIMGSQLTALGIFTQFWFPNMPLWLLATIFGVLGLLVVLTGINGFERFENIFAVVKVAAILMFIIIACLALFGVFEGDQEPAGAPTTYGQFLSNGWMGLWTSFIYAFYAFGGIEVMGIMANELKDPKEGPKSGKVMLSLLTTIYLISIGLALYLVSWDTFTTEDSPFVVALEQYNLSFVPHVFNGALVIAGFSTMVASLYAITTMLVTLAKAGDAPKALSKVGKKNIPYRALSLTTSGLILSIVVSLLLPDKIYEYLTTAAGLMLLYTWLFILLSFRKLMDLAAKGKIFNVVGMLLIILAVFGTLFDQASRPGFFISLLFLVLIGIVTLMMKKKWRNEKPSSDSNTLWDKYEKD
ncbi:amino acid permease [Radiobacillus kanasensis]|uniref:amino acid permease n=1 Tax=Radiobacillus kanasensis TaxID=2844358 RepID=UPI001E530C97|nr:amino acid permease [Radiobacillus kanasensis]UFT99710.1 amino acid permease [Radiobacillus kanasensis]